jgi:tRNA(adenine34) deaminase
MMERCFEVAQRGADKGELPFGAVIVCQGQVIAEATNCVSSEGDVTRHAELVALSSAQKALKRKRLQDCTLYSIVEPCPMCSFPAREARIGRVVFALSSPVMGGYSKWDVLKDDDLSSKLPEVFGPPPEIVSGLLAAQAEQVWSRWHPLAWRIIKRRGCIGALADLPKRHAAAPRPLLSWSALAAFLAAPALSVSNTILRSRGGHARRGSRLFFGALRDGQSTDRGQGLQKVRDDHLRSLSIDLVALAKCTAEQFLLGAGTPGQGRDDPQQRNKESRPAGEGERFAHGEQCKAQIDGMSHQAIRAGCHEPGALICFGREAPSGTKLGMADDDEGGAR